MWSWTNNLINSKNSCGVIRLRSNFSSARIGSDWVVMKE